MLNLQCLTQNSLTKNYSVIENILHAFNILFFRDQQFGILGTYIREQKNIEKKVATLENEIEEQIS